MFLSLENGFKTIEPNSEAIKFYFVFSQYELTNHYWPLANCCLLRHKTAGCPLTPKTLLCN